MTDLRRVQELFELVADLPGPERHARLRDAGADPALITEVEELLTAAEDAPAFLEDELLGTSVPPYRITERLHAGGMGVVYKAMRTGDLEIPVALKVVRAELAHGDLTRLFLAEQQTLRALRHPHIVTLQDVGELEDGRPFLVTELVDGLPIDTWVRDHRLQPRGVVELFLTICGAVQFAHQRLVVHCDLKPAHVLLTADGVPKLIDFGIARVLGAAEGCTGWTEPYASPEQRRGEEVTVATDVHALGVLLGELLGEHTCEDLRAICERATRPDPEDRYPDVHRLQQDLRAWLDNRPVEARGGGTGYRVGRFAQRNRWAVVASGVAVVASIVAGVALYLAWQNARDDSRLGWGAHAQAAGATLFLEQLLLATRGASGDDYRLALDRASDEVATRFAGSPEAEGRIRLALATLERDAGRLEAARRHADRALELVQSHRGFGRRDLERAQRLQADLRR